MTTVVLVSPRSVEIPVSSIDAFERLIYGYGYRPKTGTIDANRTTLTAGSPPPSPDPSQLVRIGDLQSPTSDAQLALRAALVLPVVGGYTYNADGTVASGPTGETYAYNTDGTVHSVTLNGVTRTFSYNTDGTIASAA